MATVCLHGNTSTIQKSALVGAEPRNKKLIYAGKVTSDKTSLGLVGLLNLNYTDKEGIDIFSLRFDPVQKKCNNGVGFQSLGPWFDH